MMHDKEYKNGGLVLRAPARHGIIRKKRPGSSYMPVMAAIRRVMGHSPG